MKRILVTPRSLAGSNHPAIQLLRKQSWKIIFGPSGRLPDESELLQLVPGCEGWLAGVEAITGRVLEAADQLQVISRNGSGIDNISMEIAKSRGIAVLRAAGANAQGVAELTLGLALAAVRQFHLADRHLKEGKWERALGSEIKGKHVLLVGFGKIGRLVANLFDAFGASVSVVEPMEMQTDRFAKIDFAAGVAAADIVTLHCPPLADGHPMITEQLLESARPGLVLINCARRALVDENAVLRGLEIGKIGIYACDVFEEADADSAVLLGHPRVIATPHLGAYTKEGVNRAALEAAENLLRFFAHTF
jgi:D-3-phosphoglycerate dehydrogenase